MAQSPKGGELVGQLPRYYPKINFQVTDDICELLARIEEVYKKYLMVDIL